MFSHKPVLLKETIDGLNVKKDGIYVDATLGGGGHTRKILEIVSKGNGFVIGIDQDIDAINYVNENLKEYIDKKKLVIVKSNFENVDIVLKDLNIDKIDGILFDLGVSSYQLDEKDRGFTYREDTILDMRMDKDNTLTCEMLINTYSEQDLYHIIKDYGEEKFAKNIAKNIVMKRNEKPIKTTFELVDIIKSSIPAKLRWGDDNKKNPAKRTFQALRIYINRELEVISIALDKVIDYMNEKGRILVITFQSLEDKIVKEKFKSFENPCICPKGYPCVCGRKSKGYIVTKKVVVADNEELANNRRSKPAKLRIFERM